MGRDISWGGKPQLYYYVTLDFSAEDYLQYSKNTDKYGRILDKDREILLIHSFDLLASTGFLKLRCINRKKLLQDNILKYYIKICKAESSFFSNCYHFSKFEVADNWLHNKIMN